MRGPTADHAAEHAAEHAGNHAGGGRRTARAAAAAVTALVLLSALPAGAPAAAAGARPDRLQQAFTEAAERYGVPPSVLLGVSYLQSRWDEHHGAASVSGGYGPMHLTDGRTALAEAAEHHHGGGEDARGDTRRPRTAPPIRHGLPRTLPPRLRTLHRAAALTGLPAEELRRDPAANVQGGAALLAAEQRRLGRPPSEDPADWRDAVAGYSGAEEPAAAAAFADDVYDVIRSGRRRVTDAGRRMVLPATPVAPAGTALSTAAGRDTGVGVDGRKRPGGTGTDAECPPSVSCSWIPAPYEEFGDGDYGNHDQADRPRSQQIDYIVIHDTEGSWDVALGLVQDPTYVSWHYTLRSSDGHIAQHVRTEDVAWHAGNWFVNAKSIGLEHEGILTAPDAWYTEAMYRTSARLVRYLAAKYDVPLDRQHILGHDNVPGVTTAHIPGMHTDPGPYWDWQHYFTLLGSPFTTTAGPGGGLVTVRPDYAAHQPDYTRCDGPGTTCPPHGSAAVRLRTAPRADAPLVRDIGLRPDGGESTTGVNDTGARASTGQRYAVAGRSGAWTAIWYLGRRAWFRNPAAQPTAVRSRGLVVTPRHGREQVPVYGRAYPEADAYPPDVPVQPISPLPYTLRPGQRYALGLVTKGEYYFAKSFDPVDNQVIRGSERYYQIQFGHRVAFVKAADVRVLPSFR